MEKNLKKNICICIYTFKLNHLVAYLKPKQHSKSTIFPQKIF